MNFLLSILQRSTRVYTYTHTHSTHTKTGKHITIPLSALTRQEIKLHRIGLYSGNMTDGSSNGNNCPWPFVAFFKKGAPQSIHWALVVCVVYQWVRMLMAVCAVFWSGWGRQGAAHVGWCQRGTHSTQHTNHILQLYTKDTHDSNTHAHTRHWFR